MAILPSTKSNVLPSYSILNASNYSTRNSVIFCNYSVKTRVFTNIQNILFGKFNVCKELLSILFNHIMRIVFGRTRKQMFGVYTGRVVALMKNKHPFWNRSFVNYPRSTVSISDFFIRNYKNTISGWKFTSLPNPTLAFGSFIKMSFKAFLKGSSPTSRMSDNKTDWLSLDMPILSVCFRGNRSRVATAAFTEFNFHTLSI